MDPETRSKKIIDLSESELTTLGFLGPNSLQGVRDMVQKVKQDPVRLGNINCFQIDLLRRKYAGQTPAQGGPAGYPTSPTHPPFQAPPS